MINIWWQILSFKKLFIFEAGSCTHTHTHTKVRVSYSAAMGVRGQLLRVLPLWLLGIKLGLPGLLSLHRWGHLASPLRNYLCPYISWTVNPLSDACFAGVSHLLPLCRPSLHFRDCFLCCGGLFSFVYNLFSLLFSVLWRSCPKHFPPVSWNTFPQVSF